MRFVLVVQTRRATGVRDPAATGIVRGTFSIRTRREPGRRVAHVGPPRQTQNFRRPVFQHGDVRILDVVAPVQNLVFRYGRRPTTVRSGGTRQTVHSVQQRALHL